jgi:hypothetical protein
MLISELTPNPKNPRTISPESLKALKVSLAKFGDLSGVVFNRTTKQLVGGHQRVQIFQLKNPQITMLEDDLGFFEYEGHKFTYREVDWSESKEMQANLAANNPNIQGVFDLDLLPEAFELAKMEEGYSELRLEPLEDLLGKEKVEEIEEDEIPEPPADPISEIGDFWMLTAGSSTHIIYCGSSTDNPDSKFGEIDLVFTDPPYGINITAPGTSINRGHMPEIAGDKDTKAAESFYQICLANNIKKMIIWGGNYFTDFLPSSRGWICWHKHSSELTFAQGELAWTNMDVNLRVYNHVWIGNNRKGDRDLELKDRVHPTQKPVTMQAQIIEDFAPEAKNVLDGFLGSGSMLVACQATDRNCYGFEIIPAYVDVSIIRWINYCKKMNLPFEVRRNGESFDINKLVHNHV